MFIIYFYIIEHQSIRGYNHNRREEKDRSPKTVEAWNNCYGNPKLTYYFNIFRILEAASTQNYMIFLDLF